MKKIFIALCASFALASCTTITKTATSIDVENGLTTNSMADLEISSQRDEHVYYTEARARRGGKKNLQNTAVKELLMKSGNADVLVAPEFTFVKRRGSLVQNTRALKSAATLPNTKISETNKEGGWL